MSDQGFQGGMGDSLPGSPLAAPPQGYVDPYEQHSQFHTIIRRITGEEGVGEDPFLRPRAPRPASERGGPPPPKVVVGGNRAALPPLPPPPPPSAAQGRPPFAEPLPVASPGSAQPQPFAEPALRQGKLVALFGCKGGVGDTFTAVNLAVALSRTHNVCLVDMDLQMGDVLVSLNMEGRCAISHIIREIHQEGDGFNPRGILDRHEATGVYVLSQVHCLEELDLLKPAEVSKLFAFMKLRFPFVVVDGLRSFDDNSMTILDAADNILLVVNQDVPSVRSASRSMEIFHRIGYDKNKLVVVVNRYYRKALVGPEYIAMSLKTDRVLTIRHDFETAVKSLNEGVPLHLLAPQSRITGDIDALADLLRDRQGKPGPGKRGLMAKLRSWKKR